MDGFARTTKERARCYMQHRQADHRPPLSMEEIRRQLGWAFRIEPAVKKSTR